MPSSVTQFFSVYWLSFLLFPREEQKSSEGQEEMARPKRATTVYHGREVHTRVAQIVNKLQKKPARKEEKLVAFQAALPTPQPGAAEELVPTFAYHERIHSASGGRFAVLICLASAHSLLVFGLK